MKLSRLRTSVLLALLTFACGSAPQAPLATQPATTSDSSGEQSAPQPDVLKELMQGAARADDADAWLRANVARIDPDVTQRALELAHGASSQAPPLITVAYYAFQIAGVGFAAHGAPGKAAECRYNAGRAAYMQINEPQAYAGLRLYALEVAQAARAANELQLASHALTLAANCTYFGSALGVEPEPALADSAMLDWIAAAELMVVSKHPTQGLAFEDFASLGGALARDALLAYAKYPNQDTTLIRQFASKTEETIPIDYDFQAAEKTTAVHSALTELSRKYGSKEIAKRRAARPG